MVSRRDPNDASPSRDRHSRSGEPRSVSQRLLGPWSILAAWLVLGIAIFHPPTGMSVPLCIIRSQTSIPCPGCGLSRSVSSFARGMVAQGASMHPFGAVILVWAIVVVCVSLSPTTMRSRVASFLQNHHRPVMILYVGFVVSFVAFGVLRAVSHFAPFSITTPPP